MNAQHVWMAQATQAPRISLDYIRHRTTSVEQGIRRRSIFNYVSYGIALIIIGWTAWRTLAAQPLMVAPLAYFAGMMVYGMYRQQHYVARQASPADAGILDTLRFHRRQLERQRDFRRWSWRWGVLVLLLPGAGLKIAAMVIYSFPPSEIVESSIIVALGSAVVIALGEYRAHLSQREIDALDSLAKDS